MVIPILNRVVKFLEARSAMVRNQASQRVSHHKSLMIYKASAQSLS